MEKLAITLIIIGAVFWCFSIFFMEAGWQPQILSAVILIIGIIIAHVWEEIFRESK
jgi:fatty acid desaturase